MSAPPKNQNLIPSLFQRRIALPGDHGSWVFLISPLCIGLFAGENFSFASMLLVLAAFSAFLIRQPITHIVKVSSGRRTRRDLPASIFWVVCYGALGLLVLTRLISLGFGYLLWLAVPGVPVFAWHLFLVSRRAERRQAGVEIVATGVLALAAPAAFWVGRAEPDPSGWWLFGLSWLQSAASIVYAYLRLSQRELKQVPDRSTLFRMGSRAFLYTTFNLVVVILLSIAGFFTAWLFLPYLIQWVETLWGIFNPAAGWKPTRIGLRQLAVSSLFTLVFILVW